MIPLSLWNDLLYPWWYSLLWNLLFLLNIASPAFFWLMLTWFIVFPPVTFNLYLSLYLKCVSYRQHILCTLFFIQYEKLSFLFGLFELFTLNVVIGMVIFEFINLVFIFCLSHLFFFFFFFFCSFLVWVNNVVWSPFLVY